MIVRKVKRLAEYGREELVSRIRGFLERPMERAVDDLRRVDLLTNPKGDAVSSEA